MTAARARAAALVALALLLPACGADEATTPVAGPSTSTAGTPPLGGGASAEPSHNPSPAFSSVAPPSVASPSLAASSPAPSRYRIPKGQLHRKLLQFDTGYQPKQVAFSPDGGEIWVTPLGSAGGVEVYDAHTGKPGSTGDLDVDRRTAISK